MPATKDPQPRADAKAASIRVGIAGWSYPDWEGVVYPRAKGRGFHPLAYLAAYVDAVEVNSSFYALPDVRHVARWAEIAAPHPLEFTAKLHRDLTHATWTEAKRDVLAALLDALEPLRASGRLTALLAQFPIGFVHEPTACRHLGALAEGLRGRAWVVEVRHRSWFAPDGLAALRSLGASVAHLDLPRAPEHLPEDAPQVGPLGYLRLHGRNAQAWFRPEAGRDGRYDWRYAPAELEAIAERTRRIAATVAQTLVIANNHYGGKGLAAALELKARLAGGPVPAPDTIAVTFPDLAPWIRVRGQQPLF
jgi:uncharacterized protein YecE (DUF72 family)